MENKRYGSIDGLRTIACIGIVMMHMQANNDYQIPGFIYERIIPAFTDFVFLFMTISAFGMCCGYCDKILKNQISLEEFYLKRYSKVLPFFSLLVLADVIVSHNKNALIEGFADMTLLFGLFPNNISVIGVGWFLGLIFVFYLIFPFFCVLLKSKKRAWISFVIFLILNYVCGAYFKVGRENIAYSICYMQAGGLIYLYRDDLEKFSRRYWWIALTLVIFSVILYFCIRRNTLIMILVSVTMLVSALTSHGILQNRFTELFGSVSMEVYLSHMAVFRVFERLELNIRWGYGWMQYMVTTIVVLVGAMVFSIGLKKMIEVIGKKIGQNVQNR